MAETKALYTPEEFDTFVPKIFTIETALACNLKCPECAISGDMIGRAKNLMRFDKFKIIADKIRPYAEYVYLHLWGEPMLNKSIFEMIGYVSKFARTNISTNSLLLDRDKAERLISSGVSDIIVSIDGFSQEVYEKYRVGGNVIDALERLVWLQEFNIRSGNKVRLMPQFIVFKHNQHEMRQFRDFCRSIGLEPLFKAPYIRNQESHFERPDDPEYQRKEYDSIEALRSAMRHCVDPKEVFTMLSDGSVVVCCYDFDKFTHFGNIFEQEVLEIWNSPEFRQFRWDIVSGKAPRFCLEKCMTFVPSKKCQTQISGLASNEIEKMTAPRKEALVTIGKPKIKRNDIADQTPVAPEPQSSDIPKAPTTRIVSNPALIQQHDSSELRELGRRMQRIEEEFDRLGNLANVFSQAADNRILVSKRDPGVVSTSTADSNEEAFRRYHAALKRVRRLPVRVPFLQPANATEVLERARTAFREGNHLEAIDLYEQLVEVLPELAVPLLAELYDQYQSLPQPENRYSLYVARHFDFNIPAGAKVLDIGSGHDPFPFATHLADIAENDDQYGRAGIPLKKIAGKPFFECSVENMPFEDKEFEFVYCSHVLEHTDDPARACEELMRVSRRGYIECPTRGKDLWLNTARVSHHHWAVENVGGCLTFTRYTEDELNGIGSNILMSMHCSPESVREKAFAALVCLKATSVNTMLYWEDEIHYNVRTPPSHHDWRSAQFDLQQARSLSNPA